MSNVIFSTVYVTGGYKMDNGLKMAVVWALLVYALTISRLAVNVCHFISCATHTFIFICDSTNSSYTVLHFSICATWNTWKHGVDLFILV